MGKDGTEYLAEALKANSMLQTLKYAATQLAPYCQQPLTLWFGFVHSLANNNLTNYGSDMSGVIKLAEALKTNSCLRELK